MIGALGPLTVPTPGTPVSVSTLLPANKHQPCHGILFQALPTNTGKVYVGNRTLDSSTLVGCYAILAIPTTNQLPTFSAALTIAPNGLDAAQTFFVDADNADDGVLVTILVT